MPVGIPLVQASLAYLPVCPTVAFLGGVVSGTCLIFAAMEQPTYEKIVTAATASISTSLLGFGSLLYAFQKVRARFLEAQVKIEEIKAHAKELSDEREYRANQAKLDRQAILDAAELKRKADYDLAELRRRTEQHDFAGEIGGAKLTIEEQRQELADQRHELKTARTMILDLQGKLSRHEASLQANWTATDKQKRDADDIVRRVDENRKALQDIQSETDSGRYPVVPSVSVTVNTAPADAASAKEHGPADAANEASDSHEPQDNDKPLIDRGGGMQ